LSGLAKTLEAAGKLAEAAAYRQRALDHRVAHEGADAWWTNRGRLDLARVLGLLGQADRALELLLQAQMSLERSVGTDDDGQELMEETQELIQSLRSGAEG
jgi:tetratricopeptide (TPR) repeat protein